MVQIGVTGGIGSGKTLVCSVLEKLGVAVYYADLEARRLMTNDEKLVNRIVELLGEEAYDEHALNREYLAQKVFGDRNMLIKLNAIVHPAVRFDYSVWVKAQRNVPYVVHEAAILFESGSSRQLDGTVLVYAPEALRIRRVIERDGVEEASVRKRMKHQMNEEEKKQLADYIIFNDEDHMLLPQIIDVHNQILNKSR